MSKNRVIPTRRVFIIEDDPCTRLLLAFLLEKRGDLIEVHDRIAGALKRIKEFRPDVVILDLNLSDGSGMQLLRTIREEDGGTPLPVVILTERTRAEDQIQGFEDGANGYILKPLIPDIFLDAVAFASEDSFDHLEGIGSRNRTQSTRSVPPISRYAA